MSVDLPPDAAAFPDGPNVKTVTQNCLACHSADMVLDQPLAAARHLGGGSHQDAQCL